MLYSNYLLLCNKNNFILTGIQKERVKKDMYFLKMYKKHDNYNKKGINILHQNV